MKRIELRQLANTIGNEALQRSRLWPADGSGREVKALTEAIVRRLSDSIAIGDVHDAFSDLQASIGEFRSILSNYFFRAELSSVRTWIGEESWRPLSMLLIATIRDTETGIAEQLSALQKEPSPIERLASLVPDQSPAPLKFEVADGVLRAKEVPFSVAKQEQVIAEAARLELLSEAQTISDYLTSSNQDPSFVDVVVRMRDLLGAEINIIQIGIFNLTLSKVVDKIEQELPDSWHGRLQGFSIGIGMLVSQHKDWLQFAENSARANFQQEDARALQAIGREIVDKLELNKRLVDPGVPRDLRHVMGSMGSGRQSNQRALFASLMSFSNLLAVIAKSVSSLSKKYSSDASDGIGEGVKSAASTATKITLLSLFGTVFISLGAVAARVLNVEWIGAVGKLLVEAGKKGAG
ncbi:hypothetical protein FHS97_000982 [Sphingomonas endophytica]|uniref:Uncharacterized protein n=1 Tax=Sphingomonas endophytica TaxID=869719 RepID=A0ABR6N2Q1_9SPHN|nr:hypothetical protein [Sphingomonas endophytica]MBB5725074.1 hypothetical protein [Sphingomonas endophytica]